MFWTRSGARPEMRDDLLGRRLAPMLGEERRAHLADAPAIVGDVHRQTQRAVEQRALDAPA